MTEQEIIAQAMSIIGSRRTDRKKEAARLRMENIPDGTRARMRQAQQARRERERLTRAHHTHEDNPA